MLPRFKQPPYNWVAPALALTFGGSVLASHASESDQAIRNLLFLGGPLILFSGIHDRICSFIHADERYLLLHNPIESQDHWRQAMQSFSRQLAFIAVAGTATIVASQFLHPDPGDVLQQTIQGLIYASEWLWLCLFVGLLEPIGCAFAALAGRRYSGSSWVSEMQHTLSNGWTTPEATIHLYAPAVSLATATLLALPGQLTLARLFTESDIQTRYLSASLTPLIIAIFLRFFWAPHAYYKNVWYAVPWLEEARKSLGDFDQASPVPIWIRQIRDPVFKLIAIQWLRLTPLPHLRLLALLGYSIWLFFDQSSPSLIDVSIGSILIAWWILPTHKVFSQKKRISQLCSPLPLPEFAHHRIMWKFVLVPPFVLIAVFVSRSVLS